jgi:large subunit ribosomal protein L12
MAEEKKEEKAEKQKPEEKAKPGKKSANYVYGALLLHSAGKEINEGNMEKVVSSAGISADKAQIKALVASLEGVDIDEAIKSAAIAPVAAAPASAGKEEKAEEKKEEKEEKKAEAAAAGLSSLFG